MNFTLNPSEIIGHLSSYPAYYPLGWYIGMSVALIVGTWKLDSLQATLGNNGGSVGHNGGQDGLQLGVSTGRGGGAARKAKDAGGQVLNWGEEWGQEGDNGSDLSLDKVENSWALLVLKSWMEGSKLILLTVSEAAEERIDELEEVLDDAVDSVEDGGEAGNHAGFEAWDERSAAQSNWGDGGGKAGDDVNELEVDWKSNGNVAKEVAAGRAAEETGCESVSYPAVYHRKEVGRSTDIARIRYNGRLETADGGVHGRDNARNVAGVFSDESICCEDLGSAKGSKENGWELHLERETSLLKDSI